jgi:hypothetical protein
MTKDQINTEAKRLARNMVKAELKRQKVKISFVEVSAISKAVRFLLKHEPDIFDRAKRNLKRLYDIKRRNTKRWRKALERLP